MAKEGAKLTNFYVAAPLCTPSRAGLMTGCYAQRIDMGRGQEFGVLLAEDGKGMNPSEITIAEVAKSAGYKTGMFGKWHLGDQPEFMPTKQGFEEFFGLPYSHDIHTFHPAQKKFNFPPLALLEGEKVIELEPNADYLTKRITEKAVDYIKRNKKNPFFMYVAHPIPHGPVHASPPFMEAASKGLRHTIAQNEKNGDFIDYRNRNKIYPFAVNEIDWSVGQILGELKKQGIDKNTIVIFTSDNGPAKGVKLSSAGPLKGYKGTTHEGGMREPTVVRWPKKIKAGQVNGEMMTAMDLLPTIANLLGYEMPDDRTIDGKDILATLTKKAPSPHEYLFYYFTDNLRAVRYKNFKMHYNGKNIWALYDLEKDIGEENNILKDNAELAKEMLKVGQAFDAKMKKNMRPAGYVDNPKALSMEKQHK